MNKLPLVFLLCCVQLLQAQFLDSKKDLKSYEGFFDFHYDEKNDAIYLEVDKLDSEFIYVHALKSGLGSNDIGLDRGQLGGTAIVKFMKAGNKLLLVQPNQDYRAITDNSAERESVKEAFAFSVLYGFEIKERKDKTYIIDLTPFLMEDAHGVSDRIKANKEGTYKLDKEKSALSLKNTKAFPKNVEFEALLTFKGNPEGRMLRSVAPDAGVVSTLQHHSFVELPEPGYEPRVFDPKSGAIYIQYKDYATPVQEHIDKRLIIRHRLEKKNPELEVSEAVEPIIYYLDPGTPEPVRSALLEGASWWNQAYESIGYKNAFQVKMLPDGADPLDLRYNVIQWVHRSTRGWSYGASVTDPRTGEILKGHVSLGSLRIRQDFMIAQAMMNQPFADSDDNYEPMLEMALARIRQLSAHEVGHTLGFAHNFAASVNERASVMDYPHPAIKLKGDEIDFSDAYATGIGAWDKVTVAYSYGDAPKGMNESWYLNQVLEEAEEKGLRFISDSDARAANGAHPDAHLWDNGANAADELKAVLALREKAIENFSIDNIHTGEPLTVLEDVFVPLYFYHRYQTEGAVKSIGGVRYTYAVKDDEQQQITNPVASNEQEQALEAVLETLKAEHLAIPADKLGLFPPRAFGYGRTRESFKGNTGVTFDPLGAAETAADFTLDFLLNAERANRLVAQHAVDRDLPGFESVLQELIDATFRAIPKDSYFAEVQRSVNNRVLEHMKQLMVNPNAITQVKASVFKSLTDLAQQNMRAEDANTRYMAWSIGKFLEDPDEFKPVSAPKIPDGSPIGSYECLNLDRND
ncbi:MULTISPECIES: zinc-dependent metalloprotease [unclassified Leeuwenhoekiella]|uniref:zinc-dependent metalloprotease n=1 Tax=unclassified Leeuwenhoekiella TaxID=2615029 RepID=UPI000C51D4CE|nr:MULTISPECIES: zinc-dependent metalloprotease [unclassified Leeuwenhoekiella]MAW95274.1 peptidase [Leeuwenhoekiella sp.]MBA81803.1 peptidase [Leeuwenhoekiella sp.]